MSGLRRPVVAGLGPGAGTSVLAAALHGVDAGRWAGGPVDVLVCPADDLPDDLPADLPVVPVLVLRGRRPAVRHAGAVVVLPEVAAWHGTDATHAAAALLGLAPHRRPPAQRGYADALLAVTAALVRSGALAGPACPPAPAAPRAPLAAAPAVSRQRPARTGPARHPAPAPAAAGSIGGVPAAARSTGLGGTTTRPTAAGPTAAGSGVGRSGGSAPEPAAPVRAPGRVVIADPRRRAAATRPRPDGRSAASRTERSGGLPESVARPAPAVPSDTVRPRGPVVPTPTPGTGDAVPSGADTPGPDPAAPDPAAPGPPGPDPVAPDPAAPDDDTLDAGAPAPPPSAHRPAAARDREPAAPARSGPARPATAAPVVLHRAEPVRPRLVAGRPLRLAGPEPAPSPDVAGSRTGPPVRPDAARRAAARRLRIAPVVAVADRAGCSGPDDDTIEPGGAPADEAGVSALRTG